MKKSMVERLEEIAALYVKPPLADTLRDAGRLIAELEARIAALQAPVEGELEEMAKHCSECAIVHTRSSEERDAALLRSAAYLRAAGRRIAELERELAAAKERLAGDNATIDRVIAERDTVNRIWNTARDEAEKRIAELERELKTARDESAYRLSRCLKRAQEREQALERAKAAESAADMWKQCARGGESRIEGRTHEQTHALLKDALQRLQERQVPTPHLLDRWHRADAAVGLAPDPAFEARKRAALEWLGVQPFTVDGSATYQFLKSLAPPAAPAKREVTEEDRRVANDLRKAADLLQPWSFGKSLQHAADVVDGGEGR